MKKISIDLHEFALRAFCSKGMRILVFSFLLTFIFSTNAVFAPLPVVAERDEQADWSALFPEIEGCERLVEPLANSGKIFEQTAVYRRQGAEDVKDTDYNNCGSITLRFEPSARKNANAAYAKMSMSPFTQKKKVKTFDAYSHSPQCGNDIWIGSTSVYFDDDKILTVSQNLNGGNILHFAEKADYRLLKKTIEEFIKNKSFAQN